MGIHRIIEGQSSTRAGQTAIVGLDRALTYRDLNQCANHLARELIARGLRRGSRVMVRMERSPEAVVAMLAVLKAGASYTWIEDDADGRWPYGISVVTGDRLEPFNIDVRCAAAAPRQTPNLPIVTRSADIACLLPQGDGAPAVLVPHATITSLQLQSVPERCAWSGEPGAFDVWLALMAGATLIVEPVARAAAA